MSSRFWKLSALLAVCAGLFAHDAAAWGPKARRAVGGTAIQVIRKTYPSAFKTVDISYDEDVLRGIASDPCLLNHGKPFTSEQEAVIAVQNEVQLLRAVRKYGFGSYFSFRLGVLGALASDLVIPFALDPTPSGQSIREQMNSDIDTAVDHYSFTAEEPKLRYVHEAAAYFRERREFFGDSKQIIANDYQAGKGYNGYLKEGGRAFFNRAIISVADLWNTVLQVKAGPGEVAPSQDEVVKYLVAEIRYLLKEKGNYNQAIKSYANLDQVAKSEPAAYHEIGDLFYNFGTDEAKERGVREWRIAYDMPGSDRRVIGKKLSEHYVGVGEKLLASAKLPGASDQDLPNALNAFTQALEFDQTSKVAAQRINETNVAINERKERRSVNVNIIASAEKVKVQAEKARVNGDFGNAITTYTQAIGLYQAIDNEFTDQASVAKESIKEANKSITDIINQVLDSATDEIDKGDKAVTEHRFEDAVSSYERVPNIVGVIPGDESSTHGKEKADVIELSKKKIEESKVAKSRWEELERKRKADAEAARGKPQQ